jgi:tellurite resistance protein TehA-like permease
MAGGSTTAERPGPLPRLSAAVRDLHPGSFAFVMATGIISSGAFLLGVSWLSRTLLVVTASGFIILGFGLLIRLVVFRSSVAADVGAPDQVFGFFTVTAAADVLAVRLAEAGHPVLTAAAAGLAAVTWLALTYGVPASLLLSRGGDSVLGSVNGSWLLWVVGTQSLSVACSPALVFWACPRIWP